jgi:hypothetical protein
LAELPSIAAVIGIPRQSFDAAITTAGELPDKSYPRGYDLRDEHRARARLRKAKVCRRHPWEHPMSRETMAMSLIPDDNVARENRGI